MRNERKAQEEKEREGKIIELRKKVEEGRAAALRLHEMGAESEPKPRFPSGCCQTCGMLQTGGHYGCRCP